MRGGSEIDCDDGVDGLLILPHDALIGMDIRAYLGRQSCARYFKLPQTVGLFYVRGIARGLQCSMI